MTTITERAETSTPDTNDQTSRRRKQRHRAVPLMPEVRHLTACGLEVRDQGGSGDTVTIVGIPLVYNTAYTVVDAFGEFEERMSPGVASEVLGADVRFLIDHDPSRLLARTASGTLKLTDSDEGVRMAATIDLRDSDARNLMIRLERGDVNQMSCGFIVGKDEWNDDMDQRTIHKFADLLDVSAVTYPASPTTSIEVAQRMALRMQMAGIRMNKIERDLRAGKSISTANENMILTAVQNLHAILDAAGSNPYTFTNGSPDDDGKGTVPPEPSVDGFDTPTDQEQFVEQDSSDGLAAEPLIDPGDQIRSKPSPDMLVRVRERHGRRRSHQLQESEDLLREAKRRIL